MGYTIAEKILLAHSKREVIKRGEFIEVLIDVALGNDITAPLAIEKFKRAGFKKVFNRNKIVLVSDHFVPAKDMRSANQAKILSDFAREYGIKNYFDIGTMGIGHVLLPEKGLVLPGDLVIGADSHTCTYGALGAFSTGIGSTDLARAFMDGKFWLKVPNSMRFIYRGKLNRWISGKDIILFTIGKIGVDGALGRIIEFSGPLIRKLSMDDRFTMCNMAVEAGAVTGIMEPDKVTQKYISSIPQFISRIPKFYSSDKDAFYDKIYEWDLSRLEPQVACPYLPSNVKPVSSLKNIKIEQAIIGSCTNGRITDLRIAARILKDRKINSGVRLIIIPGTQDIYKQAIKEGLAETFIKAGSIFSTPTCGPCLGGHMGILAENETCIATTNRNFIGRMGSVKSYVYLASPAVVAASAIKGKITHPAELIDR
ncbi:MAG: 3-isopropylmalate dehydratase large subunit [Candidatus Omnitrophica bacterium]|nr:3-isopropylmalate dehydratase large subunit [Candidatus Omnitrophota bacterium]